MRIVNLLTESPHRLAVLAVVIALAAVVLAFSLSSRSVASSETASGGWHPWAVTALVDAVIIDADLGVEQSGRRRPLVVTVCNDSRRAVAVDSSLLNHRGCMSVTAGRVKVVAPFSARGRYRIERGL